MKILRVLLLPISLLYGCVTWVRNLFFDLGILRTQVFKLPIIGVGNLSVGGTGKTPHSEYLIKTLSKEFKITLVSRGYGRITSGHRVATLSSTSREIGDEPKQIKQKFNDKVNVVVNANRVKAIKKVLSENNTEIVILDDAYQHRSVKSGLNILLTPYQKLFINDMMMPTGYLREWASGSRRADIIVVTKSPEVFSQMERRLISDDLNPKPYQKVYFSYYEYGNLTPLFGKAAMVDKDFYFDRNYSVLLLTGIANASNIYYYLKNKMREIEHLSYPDHHVYSVADIEKITKVFDNIAANNKIILTTEKDAMRLISDELINKVKELPIFYLPIEVKFHGNDGEEFDKQILRYVRDNKIDS